MADDWEETDLFAALDYSPFELDRTGSPSWREADASGADKGAEAIRVAHRLLDSVAFVSKEGDTALAIKTLVECVPA